MTDKKRRNHQQQQNGSQEQILADDPTTSSSAGSSRASKKRAKKRLQKQQQQQQQQQQQTEHQKVQAPLAEGNDRTNSSGTSSSRGEIQPINRDGEPTSTTALHLPMEEDGEGETHHGNGDTEDSRMIKSKTKTKRSKRRTKHDGDSTSGGEGETKQTAHKSKKAREGDDGNNETLMTADTRLVEEELVGTNGTIQQDEETEGHGGDGNEEDDDDDGWEKEMLAQVLSQLTPIEILFPERYTTNNTEEDDEESTTTDMDSQQQPPPQPNQYELMQTVTSKMRAQLLFQSIISPSGVTLETFYKDYWETKPLLVSKSENVMLQSITEEEEEEEGGEASKDKNTLKRRRQRRKEDAVSTSSTDANDQAEEMKRYRSRFDGLLSKKDIEGLISHNAMRYGKDINITNYCKSADGGEKRRITLDQLPPARGGGGGDGAEEEEEYVVAESKDVWSNFSEGCTIRLLCPHKHIDPIHALLSTLEDELGCMVGTNVYLTPGASTTSNGRSRKQSSQGFAPHYDDIEAFILQLEGFKRWKVYAPMSKRETLPRKSSRDFNTKEDAEKMGEPVIDVELGPGDVLYLPRGWIHQASTTCRTVNSNSSSHGSGKNHHHSLHLTASVMQNWSWVDLLEMVLPGALEAVAESDMTTSLRAGLPRNFLDYMGTMHEQNDGGAGGDLPEGLKQIASKMKDNEKSSNNPKRKKDAKELEDDKKKVLQKAFQSEAKKKMMRIFKQALTMITAGCDEMGKRHLSDRLPPAFTPQEAVLTHENRVGNGGRIWPNTMVRLARPGIARLVVEDGDADGDGGKKVVLYHSVDNSRVYREHPLSPMEFEIDDAPALEMLITTVEPHWVCVRDLIHGDIEDKMEIAQSLYDEGILAMFQEDNPDTTVQTG